MFASFREGLSKLYAKPADSSANEQRIGPSSSESQTPWDWSRDGRYLLYVEISAATGQDLWVMPMTGEQKPSVFLRTPYNEGTPQFSPDGKWVAYTSDESGRNEVYVLSFPGAAGKVQISSGGGANTRWRGDGRELYYVSADEKLMAVSVKSAAGVFERETPRILFETRGLQTFILGPVYDAAPDGRHFLGIAADTDAAQPLTLLTNWQSALSQ